MRILLIFPPTTIYPEEDPPLVFPLGIGYLAAVLEQKGYDVHVVDCIAETDRYTKNQDGTFNVGLTWSQIKGKIEEIKPDVVGVSCVWSSDYSNAIKVSHIVKEISNIPVIFGGAHATALPKEVLENKSIDYVVIGEGEMTLPLLLERIASRKTVKGIEGIGFKEGSNVTIIPNKRYIEDLDELPFPARHLFKMNRYLYSKRVHSYIVKRQPVAQMITSRGCPSSCTFCTIHRIWGKKWRFRSFKNVVDEIEYLVRVYGVKEIHFEDDNMTLDKDRVMNICAEILKRKLDICWTPPNGIWVGNLDRDMLQKMKDSGCYRVSIGIENGDQQFLKSVLHKNISLEKVRSVVNDLKLLGIKSTGFFMLGIPGETRKTIIKTIEFAKSLELDDVIFSIYNPYPGTGLYDLVISKGYLSEKINFSNFKNKYATLNTESFSRNEIENLRNKALFEFQLSKFIRNPIKYLSSLENFTTIKRYSKRFILGRFNNWPIQHYRHIHDIQN